MATSSQMRLDRSESASTKSEHDQGDQGDENKGRGNWSSKMDFLLSTIGFAVGLGNIWRFPYKCYAYGGASFLIPYVIVLVLAGLPLFFLEMGLGQFASLGPISVWKVVPLFKGIGWGMVTVSFLVGVYYNMIIAYILRYLFASFTSNLPWSSCRPEWIQYGCYERGTEAASNFTNTTDMMNSTSSMMSSNISAGPTTMMMAALNWTNATSELPRKTPSEIYWEREVLAMSPNIDEGADVLKWDLVLCLLLAWIFIFLCILGGVKTTGKVVYVTALVPYIVLIILLIWNAQLPGARRGIEFYLIPDWKKLGDAKVWYAAGTQIFYSLGNGFGGLEMMASYNRFKNNVYLDSVLVAIINCGTSFMGGFVIFSVVGFMSYKTGVPVDKVAADGPGLAFIAYPEGIALMPAATFWAILFFIMLFTLGVDSQFAMVETVITAVVDEFPVFQKGRRKIGVLAVFCVIMFLIGLPLCSQAGIYILQIFDWYSGGLNVIIIAFLEVIGIAWIYGFRRFNEDIEMMIGHKPNYYWIVCWVALTPIMVAFLFFFSVINISPVSIGDYVFPAWADGLGWLMFTVAIVFLPLMAIIEAVKMYMTDRSLSALGLLRQLTRPAPDWGPALEKYRTGRYAPMPNWSGLDNKVVWTSSTTPKFDPLGHGNSSVTLESYTPSEV